MYFGFQDPSDAASGYAAGFVWVMILASADRVMEGGFRQTTDLCVSISLMLYAGRRIIEIIRVITVLGRDVDGHILGRANFRVA
jgi:hypothetical protein